MELETEYSLVPNFIPKFVSNAYKSCMALLASKCVIY